MTWGPRLDDFRAGAQRGNPKMRRKLASQPFVDEKTEPYLAAWQALARDRRKTVLGVGFGSVAVPDPIDRESIRLAGERLGYEADDLERFVTVVAAADDHYVDLMHQRINADVLQKLAEAESRARRR